MRSWHPILPSHLDRAALLSEHGEVHLMLAVLAGRILAWAHHPETLRWVHHRRALVRRHNTLAHELRRRHFNHGTPVHPSFLPTGPDRKGPVPLRQSLRLMRKILRQKIEERRVK